VVGGVDAGLDLPLGVEVQQGVHGLPDQIKFLQVAQVEAAHRLVGLHQLQGADGQLVVPRLRYGQQALLLPGDKIGCTWGSQSSWPNHRLITEMALGRVGCH